MKYIFENLGVLKRADISLNKLNVICGKNNTGKTYLTYALYSLFESYHTSFPLKASISNIDTPSRFPIKEYLTTAKIDEMLKAFCGQFSKEINQHFAAPENFFKGFSLKISSDKNFNLNYESKVRLHALSEELILEAYIDKKKNVLFKSNKAASDIDKDFYKSSIKQLVSGIIKGCLSQYFLRPYAITAERTGIQLFYKELDFTRNSIIDVLTKKNSKDLRIHIMDSLFKNTSRYPDSIRDNINYIRDFDNALKRTNSTLKVSSSWEALLDGKFDVDNDEPVFIPKSSPNKKVPLHLCSSTVKSLLAFELVLFHLAKNDTIIFIDEPELGLHPEKQKAMARFLADIAMNTNFTLLITTHSDYIIREFNNLIRLHSSSSRTSLMEKYHIHSTLDYEKLNIYSIDDNILQPVEVSKDGILLKSFDGVIIEQDTLFDELFCC